VADESLSDLDAEPHVSARRVQAPHARIRTGGPMRISAAGRRVQIRYAYFWKVVDGKVRDDWVVIDVIDVKR
jgi:predicted ester cyclase